MKRKTEQLLDLRGFPFLLYWISQKVGSAFSITSCGKAWTNFLSIPIQWHWLNTIQFNSIWSSSARQANTDSYHLTFGTCTGKPGIKTEWINSEQSFDLNEKPHFTGLHINVPHINVPSELHVWNWILCA